MSVEPNYPSRTPSLTVREEIACKGSAVYERIRERLEASDRGKQVAIHVDTGDYAIGRTSAEAGRALLAGKRPDGRMFVRQIGDEPEYALAARILAGELASQTRK